MMEGIPRPAYTSSDSFSNKSKDVKASCAVAFPCASFASSIATVVKETTLASSSCVDTGRHVLVDNYESSSILLLVPRRQSRRKANEWPQTQNKLDTAKPKRNCEGCALTRVTRATASKRFGKADTHLSALNGKRQLGCRRHDLAVVNAHKVHDSKVQDGQGEGRDQLGAQSQRALVRAGKGPRLVL